MNRFSRAVLIFMLLSGIRPLAQEPQSGSGSQQPGNVTPPSPTASVEDLEKDGDSLRARKEYLDALDYYYAAMKKSDTAPLHNKAGIALLQVNRYKEARREFQHALSIDKNYADAHNNLGATYYQMRRFGAAAGEYRKAVKLNDLKASFHSNLGIAYFAMKDLDRGSREYARAMELGDRAAINYVLAKMFGQRGDAERCRLYLSKANEEGYPHVQDALKDNEFATLRKDPEFVNFVRSLKPPQQPENTSN